MIENKSQWRALLNKANKGDTEAQWEVGYYFQHGLTVNSLQVVVNPKTAVYWYKCAAKQGNDSGQLSLSDAYSEGFGVKKNPKKAIFWAKQALKNGSSSASHNLACIYRDLQKPKKSFKYYKRAVKMGCMDDLLETGLCYLFGYGVKKNQRKAKQCFKRLLQNKHEISQRAYENGNYWLSLILLLESGKNTSQNNTEQQFSRARKLLDVANRDNDHEQANDVLNLIGKSERLV